MDKLKKTIFTELVLFLTASFLSIATAQKLYKIVGPELKVQKIGIWQLVIPVFSVTLFIVFLIRFLKTSKKKEVVLKTIFILAVFSGGLITLSVWLEGASPFFIIIVLMLAWIKKPFVLLHNVCLILAVAGSASYLGLSLKPEVVLFFLVLFSVYDFIAVYKTKHMIEIAKEMLKSKAVLGIIIPFTFSGFFKSLKEIEPGSDFLLLGGGDIVSPLLLCCSLIPLSLTKALIVSGFSLLGVACSFLIFYEQKKRKPIPALPPIAVFSILGFLIAKLC